jgi:hypothetical protein
MVTLHLVRGRRSVAPVHLQAPASPSSPSDRKVSAWSRLTSLAGAILGLAAARKFIPDEVHSRSFVHDNFRALIGGASFAQQTFDGSRGRCGGSRFACRGGHRGRRELASRSPCSASTHANCSLENGFAPIKPVTPGSLAAIRHKKVAFLATREAATNIGVGLKIQRAPYPQE